MWPRTVFHILLSDKERLRRNKDTLLLLTIVDITQLMRFSAIL